MRSRIKRAIICFLPLIALTASAGCMAILEDEMLVESRHLSTPNSKPPVEQTEVSNYDELKAALLELVMQHIESGQILYYSFDDDVQDDIDRATDEIMSKDPIGAYAVMGITSLSTKIVTYFEIDVSIMYEHSKQQVDSIVAVSNPRYLRTELQSVMSDYRDEVLIRTELQGITADDMVAYVKATYYDNPRNIVMMPVTAVEIFPSEGTDKIYELRFAYSQQTEFFLQYGASLSGAVRQYAAVAGGDNDAEILLSLAEKLIGACVYDAGTANVISEHGTQNFAATAYGALVIGNAVGEGFAMAYKALCEELGIECVVILGYLDGMIHAWNIVSLYGDSYHIDVSMCAENGLETAFLKTDAEFIERYQWDFENTVNCDGELTYEEVAGIEPEIEEFDEDGNPILPDEDDETGEDEDDAGEEDNHDGEETDDTTEENAEQSEEDLDN